MDAYSEAESQARRMIEEACKAAGYPVEPVRFELPKEEFGDLASPVAFDLAKQAGKAPRRIAEELKAKIKPGDLF